MSATPRPGAPVSSTSTVRVANERVIFDVLGLGGHRSAAELVGVTGLSRPTVGIALGELEELGLVEQVGRRTGSTGRAPRLFRISAGAGGALAVDVGRQWVRAARVDLAGQVRAGQDLEAEGRSAGSIVEQVLRLADGLTGDGGGALSHTVLGSPGVYDAAAGVIRLAPNLPGWEEPAVLARLRAGLPGALVVENDINLAALAELDRLRAAGSEEPTFVFVSVGTGLGMGVVDQGRLLRGARGAAGEISYLPAEPSTGASPGRLEELTGSASIVAAAHEAGLPAASAMDVFDAARQGSAAARGIVAREAERVALALTAVVAVLDPPLIILGGGIGRNGDLLLDPIREVLTARLPLPPPEIRVSRLDVDAPLQGALADGLVRARHHAFEAATAGA